MDCWKKHSRWTVICLALASTALGATHLRADITLIKDGVAKLPILKGSVREPADELQQYLESMSGAKVSVEEARAEKAGIFVGLAADFPWLKLDAVDGLGKEGFILRSDDRSLFLIGRERAGVQHAVTTFLNSLGCRWFFPGKDWEIIPAQPTVAGSWNEKQSPCFSLQRKIWYGFGSSRENLRDLAAWERHNRMGGPIPITIGHTWHGLDPKGDFEKHPEWFALVDGQRKPKKPCYSHPEVIQRAIRFSLDQAAKGTAMISMTPPDGLGYCECERCLAALQGGKPYQEHDTTFARRPDGAVVNITSETLFQFINQVATAVAEKYPKTLVGCYAYSAYSHPPSFKLHPNVFLQTTTAFRRTPLTLPEQLEAFHKIGVQSGIRGYYSVYQWDWDYPTVSKGDLELGRLVSDLRLYQKNNVQSINAEASCNWGPRGLGYYVASRLMWDVNTDPKAVIADFYDKAFGPAALPIERYYVRWLGPDAAVRTTAASKPVATADSKKVLDELGSTSRTESNLVNLVEAFRDLDEAANLVKDLPMHRARVDQIRMYSHYLFLRKSLEEAAKTKEKAKILAAIKEETTFGGRLMNTGMIHSTPLIGKEFYRHFLPFKDYLEGTAEWPQSQRDVVQKAAGKGYRKTQSEVPSHEELEKLWAEDKKVLGIR